MSLEFMSDAWLSALTDRLATSEAYKKAAKGFSSSLALALLPEADKNVEARAIVIAINNGEVTASKVETGPGPYEADYVVRGVSENWKKLLKKEIFPAPAIMGGQLQLVKGNAMSLMTKMGALDALLNEAGQLDAAYPGL
jgi:putative sterol carrier protein